MRAVNRTPTGRMIIDATVSSGESHSMIADRDDQLPERARHQRDHPQQALDLLQVGVGARDDLPGAQGVLLGPVEARDRAEHAAAQVVLDPEREAAPEVAAQEGGAEADDGDDGHRDHQRAEARGGPGDGAVDRRADQQRSDGLEADAQHRGREGGHGERGAAPAVARETSHPATGAAGRHVLTRGDVLGGALRGALRRVVVDGRSPPRLGRHPDRPRHRIADPDVTMTTGVVVE